jgi:hypothetical protein
MKRYLVFAGQEYYPLGGWKDLIQDFDIIEEAREFLANFFDVDENTPVQWQQIVDTTSGQMVSNCVLRMDWENPQAQSKMVEVGK